MTSKTFAHDKQKNRRPSILKWKDNFRKENSRDANEQECHIFATAYNMGHKNGRKEHVQRNFRLLREAIIRILK